MTKNVLVLKHFESPKEEGVYYRLMCLTGQSKGEAYLLTGTRVIMGRSDKADIRVMDIKSSREHAEITKVGNDWVITDLGSQNGLVLNDTKITQSKLKEADKVVIGQTVYKFGRVEVKPGEKPTSIAKASQEAFGDMSREQPQPKSNLSKILILVIGGAVALMLLDSGEKGPSPAKNKKEAGNKVQDINDEFVNALRQRQLMEDKSLKQKLNTIFQRGLREYREKNYFRAINEFNLALILNPSDPLADFYLRKTKEELDKVIADHFIKAKRDEESLKYQSAIVSYCAVIRQLYQHQEDNRYKSAEENIKNLEGKLGLEPGETSCLKKQYTDQ